MSTRIEILGSSEDRFESILTEEALGFLVALHDAFGASRQDLLRQRQDRWAEIDSGVDPSFLAHTAEIRQDPTWRVVGAGPGLEDRRVEITGPTDRGMTVRALNSGAQVWVADHEDALSPTWSNVVGGQVNLYDAIRRQIDFVSDAGKEYTLGETTPTIVFRPRGLHLTEQHVRLYNEAGRTTVASAALVDFGLYVFHNAHELVARGRGPYFYLPKIESHLEARWWREVFAFTEAQLGLEPGTIRVTVLIETITAAFELDEILYELREYCAGLNAGRWDYLFSIIKTFRNRGRRLMLPDRTQLTMTVPFMRGYTDLLVATCHRRGAHAIGAMSSLVPSRRDPLLAARARHDTAVETRREVADGFDGTWVAHPDLVATALAEFDAVIPGRPNQAERMRSDVRVRAENLLDFRVEAAAITNACLRENVTVALCYLEGWLRGVGAVAVGDHMADAATAEISRAQLWQWIQQGAITEDGMPVVKEKVEWHITKTLDLMPRNDADRFDDAAALLKELTLHDEFEPFLTTRAYFRYLAEPCSLVRAAPAREVAMA